MALPLSRGVRIRPKPRDARRRRAAGNPGIPANREPEHPIYKAETATYKSAVNRVGRSYFHHLRLCTLTAMDTTEAAPVVEAAPAVEATLAVDAAATTAPAPETHPETLPDVPMDISSTASAGAEHAGPAPRRSTRHASGGAPPPVALPEKKKRGGGKRKADEVADGNAEEDGSKKAKGDAVASEEVKPLAIGDTLPALTLKNEKDEEVNTQDLAADSGVVVFLVPKADTPGCTNQACGFRDIYPDFESAGYKVYCLSADAPAAQSKWQNKFTLPYPLLSDPSRTFINVLGAGAGKKTQRSHFIFEKGGKLLDKKLPVKPADSPKLAMEFIKSLGGSSDEKAEVAEAPVAPEAAPAN